MNEKMILGYVGNTGIVTPKQAKQLTHINIAFGHLNSDGTISVEHLTVLNKMDEIRSHNPDIKIVLSLVPAEPDAFTVCCASSELREKVGESCAKMVTDFNFDGVDLDWEYPCVPSNGANCTPADKQNFTYLCKTIRQHLDAIDGQRYVLSIAAGADLYYVESVELPELMQYLDYICLMTYDLKCGFHALAGHHTQLYSSTGDVFRNSCDQALRLFHHAGVPKDRLLMGAAFYSRKWENIEDRNHGLLQISKNGGGYGPDYGLLVESYVNKNGYIRYWDDEAKAPYLFNGSTFLSYDDEESLKAKCDYIKDEGFGGIFYWEHKCDPTGTLLDTICRELND
ncbi:glycoside hydrolase family 18 protein [Vallitalea okinawensis]|uniref:glycoside hydrolase family 18 protein n=1 Tax=Vallitalea okinawensis TaxID=2078660 RepID=UPI00130067B7|nr:glycosyl hydrolase family 18 protein [Vallitalea okinawensis]